MKLEDDGFFEFVKLFSGEKLVTLFKFQDISNAECLLGCGDPFEILSFDSDDFLNLKQKMGIKLNDNSFAVLPGIKSKMKLLKDALIKKRNELKRKAPKTISSIVSTNNTSSIALSAENSNRSSSSLVIISKTEDELKQHLIYLLDEWCIKMKKDSNQQDVQLKEGIDYQIIINFTSSKVLIRCQCGANSTLGQKNNNYIVSYFS